MPVNYNYSGTRAADFLGFQWFCSTCLAYEGEMDLFAHPHCNSAPGICSGRTEPV